MGAGLGGGSSRGKGRSARRSKRLMSDINVTPFVDVMLVLLITFMVTAPLMTSGVNVDLPKAKAASLKMQQNPLVLTIDANGKLFVKNQEVSIDTLVLKIDEQTKGDKERQVYIRGDQTLLYGKMMEVMAEVTRGGYVRVALMASQHKK